MSSPTTTPATPEPTRDVVTCADSVVVCDYLDMMRSLPPKSVDALVTDMPYNTTDLNFEFKVDLSAFWTEAERLLRTDNSPVILFSQQPFTTDLIVSKRNWYRMEIIYEKSMATGFLDANRKPLRAHENIIVFSKKAAVYYPVMEHSDDKRAIARRDEKADHYSAHQGNTYNDNGARYPRSVWKFAQRHTAFSNTRTNHPTEKPIALMERLIETFTLKGDLILDCFCGAGSTFLAARNSGRHYIGCDISQEYVDLANKRLAQAYTPPLFAL